MIILDATTRSLEALLSGTVTTSQLPVVVSYIDMTSSATTPGSSNTQTNNTTAVTIIPAPLSSTQRQVKEINIYNADTASAVVTVRYNDNGTTRILAKVTLAVGSRLTYSTLKGWYTSSRLIQAVKLDDMALQDDNTDRNVSTSAHGLVPKGTGEEHKFLSALASYAYQEQWDYVYELPSTVTVDNALLQNVAGFAFTPIAGRIYEVVVVGAALGNDITGDVAVNLAMSGAAQLTLVGSCWSQGVHYSAAGALTNRVPTAFTSITSAFASPGLTINNGDGFNRPFYLKFYLCVNFAGGDIVFQLGNAAVLSGRDSVLTKGTRFMCRQVGSLF